MSENKRTKSATALARFLSDMDLGSPKMDDDYSLRLAEMRALLEPKETVKVKRLHPDAVMPRRAHAGDAGFDLVAVEDTIIEPGETALIETGLAFELPQGYEMQIRPRSGVTLKTKLRVQLGTVDSNYRGEVGVIVDNTHNGHYPNGAVHRYGFTIDGSKARGERYGAYVIRKGDRIAQAIIQRLPDVELIEVEELGDSERGEGGFGSSGVSSG